MSNYQWDKDQGIGERAMREYERERSGAVAREYHLAVVEKLEAEIRRLQADLVKVRTAHGCKGRCLK